MFLLFDIGGTHVRLSIAPDINTLSDPLIFDTPQNFDEFETRLKYFLDKNLKEQKIEKIVGGIAGVLNDDRTKLLNSPNLQGWVGKPLKEVMQTVTGCEDITIENDANLCALGEATEGAGKDFEIVAYITIGTGIGGSRIVNQKIDKNTFGFEPGHQILKISPDRKLETFEQLAGGNALHKKYGQHVHDIEDLEVIDEIYFNTACGIHNTILHWSPDVVVLGGSIGEDLDIPKLKSYLEEVMFIFKKLPQIRSAKLGKSNGVVGAFHLLKFG
ncbi:MAG: ROK family protein [Candidatus Dojkabacteria bacterium]